jgi:hypothetical protein
VSVSLDCFIFSTCVGRLQQCRVSADGPRDWVANMDWDIKARSGGHESTSVYLGASSTSTCSGVVHSLGYCSLKLINFSLSG